VNAKRNIPTGPVGSLSNFEHSSWCDTGAVLDAQHNGRVVPDLGGDMSEQKESLVGRRVRFRPDFYTTRLMPPGNQTGTIEDERRSTSDEGVTSYIVLLDEPFRSQEQSPRVDTTEDEMEPF